MPTVKLVFSGDYAASTDYVEAEVDGETDKIMEGIATKKMKIPCG